jgi:GT2 family glycosyltransferase
MKTAIVIPTFSRPQMVERVLASLSRCIFPADVKVHVVENGPQMGVERLCYANSIGGRVCYLYSEIAGKTRAINLVIRGSNADFFIFFDDDITVIPGIIETYVEAAWQYGTGHFFGGPIVAVAEASCPSHLVPYLPRSARGWSLADRETEIEPSKFSYFLGANWAVFRSDLAKSGLFSEGIGPSPAKHAPTGGETELQRRLIRASVRAIYLPDAVIRHYVSSECYTMKWVWDRHFRHGIFEYVWYRSNKLQGRDVFGIPLWVLRGYTTQQLKVLASRLFRFPIERRTQIELRQAFLAGWLYGAWTRGKT